MEEFRKLHPALQTRVLKSLLERMSPVQGGITYDHIFGILGLAEPGKRGWASDISYNLRVRREYGDLVFGKRGPQPKDYEYAVCVPGQVRMAECQITLKFRILRKPPRRFRGIWPAYMDYDQIVAPLVMRNLRPGDYIQPFGMVGRKKLQDIFTDKKIPREVRKALPILADRMSVIWVPGVVLSERMRVKSDTVHILKAEKI